MILAIDVEPDERKPRPGAGDGWSGTRACLRIAGELRAALERRTRAAVRLSWFVRLDPQIEQAWGRADHVAVAVPELAESIAAHGDFSGIHPHLWRWSSERGDWYSDLDDVAWMEHCLDLAIAGHCAIFGRAPEACRFGDRWFDEAAVGALCRRGLRYDLSVEPGRPVERPPGDRHCRGRLPDTFGVPRRPHRVGSTSGSRASAKAAASDGAEARSGGDALWIVPVTTSAPRWQPTHEPPFVVRASVSANLGRSPLLVAPLLAHELGRQDPAPLVLVLRSGDLASPRRHRNVARNAARLLAHPGLEHCVLATPPEAIRAFRARTGDR